MPAITRTVTLSVKCSVRLPFLSIIIYQEEAVFSNEMKTWLDPVFDSYTCIYLGLFPDDKD